MNAAPGPVTVRPAGEDDAPALSELSLRAIRNSASAHYDERQLAVWAAKRTVQGHRRMIQGTLVLVALVDGAVVGFAGVALRPVGHLQQGEVDQLFVAPEAGDRGVARALLTAVAEAGRAAGLTELTTHASWRALPVFERLGYEQVEVETVYLDGVRLTRVRMRCALATGNVRAVPTRRAATGMSWDIGRRTGPWMRGPGCVLHCPSTLGVLR